MFQKINIIAALLIYIITAHITAAAQELIPMPRFKNINTNFFQNTRINCIRKANNGTLWIGTENGLYWYDGTQIKQFVLPDPSDKTISSIYAYKNELLLGTHKGIIRLTPDNAHAEYLPIKNEKGAPIDNYCLLMFVDKAGKLWFFTGYNAAAYYWYDLQTKQLHLIFNQSDGFRAFKKNEQDEVTDILVILEYGMVLYTLEHNVLQGFKEYFILPAHGFPALSVRQSSIDNTDTAWCATDKGLLGFDIKTRGFFLELFKDKNVGPLNDLLLYKQYIYLATNNGVIVWDRSTRKILNQITHIPDDPFSLSSNKVMKLEISDSMLFAVTDKGISVMPIEPGIQHVYDFNAPGIPGRGNTASLLFKGNNSWLYGNGQNVYLLNPHTKKAYGSIKLPPGQPLVFAMPLNDDSWLLLAKEGIFIWRGNRLLPVQASKRTMAAGNIFALRHNGKIFIGGAGGCFQLDTITNHILPANNMHGAPYHNYYNAIALNDSEMLMNAYGSYLELFCEKENGIYLSRFLVPTGNNVNDWRTQGANKILLACSNGVRLFNGQSRAVTNVCREFNEEVYKIIVHNKDTLLLTAANIYKWNEGSIKSWEYPLTQLLHLYSPYSLIYGNDTLYTVHNNEFHILPLHPYTHAQPSLYCNTWKKDSLLTDTFINCNGNNANFTLYVRPVSYDAFMAYRVSYRLLPLERQWKTPESNEISYQRLQPGNYTLNVQVASGGNTLYTRDIAIHIIPVWYQAIWFRVAALLLALAAVGAIFAWRLRLLKMKAATALQLQQYVNELEQKALRSQMNPHFLFNTLNSINNYILKKNTLEASHYLSKFSRLMRIVLDNSRNERISLQKELDAISIYMDLEHMRFNKQFDYSIIISKEADADDFAIPPLILQPFVENAIWHGIAHMASGGMIEIKIQPGTRNENAVIIIIEDNGIGYYTSLKNKQPNKGHESFALQGTIDRIRFQDARNTCLIEEADSMGITGKGTRITIHLFN